MATTNYQIVFGDTGSGKSWVGNRLTNSFPSSKAFKEGDTLESCTREIMTAPSWNGDIVVDAPGILDTRGAEMDKIILAAFFDFIAGKSVSAILFVVGGPRMDGWRKSYYDYFTTVSPFKNVLIVVMNNRTSKPAADVVTRADGVTEVYIQQNQTDFSALKRVIAANRAKAVRAVNCPIYPSLFVTPLQNVRKQSVEMLLGSVVKDKVVKVTRTEKWTETVTQHHKKRIMGIKIKSYTTHHQVPRSRTVTEDKLVPTNYNRYQQHEVTYARRFDGKEGVQAVRVVQTVDREA